MQISWYVYLFDLDAFSLGLGIYYDLIKEQLFQYMGRLSSFLCTLYIHVHETRFSYVNGVMEVWIFQIPSCHNLVDVRILAAIKTLSLAGDFFGWMN